MSVVKSLLLLKINKVKLILEYTAVALSVVAKCFGLFLPLVLVKFENQGQFWNLNVLRIPKHPLIVEFDEELAEILRVFHNPYFSSYF